MRAGDNGLRRVASGSVDEDIGGNGNLDARHRAQRKENVLTKGDLMHEGSGYLVRNGKNRERKRSNARGRARQTRWTEGEWKGRGEEEGGREERGKPAVL